MSKPLNPRRSLTAAPQIIIHERLVKTITMLNAGGVNYNFAWDSGSNSRVAVTPSAGTVPVGARQTVELTFTPTKPEKLDR